MKQNLDEMMKEMAEIQELIKTSYVKARAKKAKEEMYGGDVEHWRELAKEINNAMKETGKENAELREEVYEREEVAERKLKK